MFFVIEVGDCIVMSSINLQYTAMAIASWSTNPSVPTKVGTLPRAFSSLYSAETPFAGTVSTISSSSPLAFATALIAVDRGLFWRVNLSAMDFLKWCGVV